MKEIVNIDKKKKRWGDERLEDIDLGEIQEPISYQRNEQKMT